MIFFSPSRWPIGFLAISEGGLGGAALGPPPLGLRSHDRRSAGGGSGAGGCGSVMDGDRNFESKQMKQEFQSKRRCKMM